MTDDPRDILRAAGVECAEVDTLFSDSDVIDFGHDEGYEISDNAILALARLVAKYKWQRDECLRLGTFPCWEGVAPADQPMSLDRRWDER